MSSVLYVCWIEIRQVLVCVRVVYPGAGELGVRWYLGDSVTETVVEYLGRYSPACY